MSDAERAIGRLEGEVAGLKDKLETFIEWEKEEHAGLREDVKSLLATRSYSAGYVAALIAVAGVAGGLCGWLAG